MRDLNFKGALAAWTQSDATQGFWLFSEEGLRARVGDFPSDFNGGEEGLQCRGGERRLSALG